MNVTILSGFLGSGKTTLLRRLVQRTQGLRLGVIVNDMSELEVDGDLVRDPELFNEARGNFASIHGGSLHDAQRAEFNRILDEWQHRSDLDHIIIETSGSTHPATLLADIQTRPTLNLDTFATLVDAKALCEDHAHGATLHQASPGTPAALMALQLRLATVILVTKTDRVTAAAVQTMATHLTQLNPQATLLAVTYGHIAPEHLIGPQRFDWSNAEPLLSLSEDKPALVSQVISDPRPLHPQRLWDLFQTQLSTGIHRSKGFLWLASRDHDVLLWQQAAGSIELELSAYWKAALVKNPDNKLLPEEITALKEMLHGTHERFGDRACDLTIIGHQHEVHRLAHALQACFCTETEITAWEHGQAFTDPWPKTLRQV